MNAKALSSIYSTCFIVYYSRKQQQQQHQSIDVKNFNYQPCALRVFYSLLISLVSYSSLVTFLSDNVIRNFTSVGIIFIA